MDLRSGVAVDLGTVNSLVYLPGRGVVVEEPSAVALQRTTGKLAAAGRMADALTGKEPVDTEVVHPLREGVVTDLPAATMMLRVFLRQARFHSGLWRPLAVMCVPSGARPVERQALVEAVSVGRPRLVVRLVDEPVAAAVGAGIDPDGTEGALVVDIGGGTTEVALVVGVHLVQATSLRTGGNAMDDAVVHALKRELGLLVGRRAGERLKIAVGLRGGEHGDAPVQVAGVDLAEGTLRELPVPAELVRGALEHPVAAIVDAVARLLSEMPPELADDVIQRGIQLAGGGALLRGLATRMEKETGVATTVVDDPLRAVVKGAGAILELHPELAERAGAAL
jgi:rod shape-determining protein MreB